MHIRQNIYIYIYIYIYKYSDTWWFSVKVNIYLFKMLFLSSFKLWSRENTFCINILSSDYISHTNCDLVSNLLKFGNLSLISLIEIASRLVQCSRISICFCFNYFAVGFWNCSDGVVFLFYLGLTIWLLF
jgi:hypothetical protein